MFDATDMTTPVTRGELREELAGFELRLEKTIEVKLEQKLEVKLERMLDEKLEQKLEVMLEQKLEVKLERMLDEKLDLKLEPRFAHLATKADLEIWGGALLAEIGRHTKAMQEALSVQVSVIDDKYADLPGRVSHLEATLLPERR